MGRMKERWMLIEDVENMVGDYRAGNVEDLATILTALRELKPVREVLAMPEMTRCSAVQALLEEAYGGTREQV